MRTKRLNNKLDEITNLANDINNKLSIIENAKCTRNELEQQIRTEINMKYAEKVVDIIKYIAEIMVFTILAYTILDLEICFEKFIYAILVQFLYFIGIAVVEKVFHVELKQVSYYIKEMIKDYFQTIIPLVIVAFIKYTTSGKGIALDFLEDSRDTLIGLGVIIISVLLLLVISWIIAYIIELIKRKWPLVRNQCISIFRKIRKWWDEIKLEKRSIRKLAKICKYKYPAIYDNVLNADSIEKAICILAIFLIANKKAKV